MGRRARRGDPALPPVPEHTWIKVKDLVGGGSAFILNQREPEGRCISLSFPDLEALVGFAWARGGKRPITAETRAALRGRRPPVRRAAVHGLGEGPPEAARGDAPGRIAAAAPQRSWTLSRYYEEAYRPAQDWTEGTAARYRSRSRAFLSHLGGYRLEEFDPPPSQLVIACRNRLREEGMAVGQVNRVISHLHTVFAVAQETILPYNPVHGIRRLKDRVARPLPDTDQLDALPDPDPFDGALTPREVETLRLALMRPPRPVCPDHEAPLWKASERWFCNAGGRGRGHHLPRELVDAQLAGARPQITPLAAYLSVVCYCGLRPSEGLGLVWGAVLPSVLVVRAQAWKGGLVGLKQCAPTREVPLWDAVREDLLALRPPDARANDLVFPSPRGGPRRLGPTRDTLASVGARVGVSFSPGDGRHTAASLWLLAGYGLGDLKQWLGHREEATTIRHYLRLYQAARVLPHVPMDEAIATARREVRRASRGRPRRRGGPGAAS